MKHGAVPALSPDILCHGTAAANLPLIAREGIKPRAMMVGAKAKGVWAQRSAEKSVYLTTAYPVHFAINATEQGDMAVVEVKRDWLAQNLLHADEDAVEQTMRGNDKLDPSWSLKRRTTYYRARCHLYGADLSLGALGTCGYRGVIPPEGVGRVVVFNTDAAARFIARGCDPFISLANYRYCGSGYRAFTRWLFGDEPESPLGDVSRDGVKLLTIGDWHETTLQKNHVQ